MSILKRIVALRCPRCGKGYLFKNPNPYAYRDVVAMNDRCPECGQDFRIETGFYFGALYISYIMGAFFCLVLFAVLLFAINIEFWWALFLTIVVFILLSPLTTRWSRAIWLALFYQNKL